MASLHPKHIARPFRHHEPAKRGQHFTFHGSFADKEIAMHKEKQVGGFILERERGGTTYYLVLTENK